MNTTKKTLYWIAISIVTVTLNGLYFEYFVSREMPAFLSAIALLVVVGVDLLVIIHGIKTLIKYFKL